MLSAVGLYAVMAYSVTQRTQEIGVRMALGARQGQVLWLVFKRGLLQLVIGLSIGLTGAYGLSRVLSPLLVSGVTATDPLTFASIAAMRPIGSSPGRCSATKRSPTMATSSPALPSASLNGRPRRMSIPVVLRNSP